MSGFNLVKLTDPLQVFVDVSGEQYTEGVAYEAMFQTRKDVTYIVIRPGLYKIYVVANPTVVDIQLPNLLIVTNSITITGNPELTAISMPVLASCPSISIQNDVLTSLVLTALASCANLSITSNLVLTSLSLPVYDGGSFTLSSNSLLTSLSLPEFTTGTLSIGANAITSLDLSAFIGDPTSSVTIGNESSLASLDLSEMLEGTIDISGCSSLTSLSFNAAIESTSIICLGCALDLASVDGILATVDGAGFSGGVLNLSGGTNASPTDGAANANKLSLEGKGWTVTVN